MTRKPNGALELRRLLAAGPGVAATFLPIGACPACWAAYSGLLGAVGLEFFANGFYGTLLAGMLFAVSLASLAYRARARRGHGPFLVGAAGVAVVLAGKLVSSHPASLYAGIAMLSIAAVWNAVPLSGAQRSARSPCACASNKAQDPKETDLEVSS